MYGWTDVHLMVCGIVTIILPLKDFVRTANAVYYHRVFTVS